MAYVDGVFSGRVPKRRALAGLGLIAGLSFATGVVRHSGPDRFTFAAPAAPAPEVGVALAQPFVEPTPILQAAAARPARRAAAPVKPSPQEPVAETAALEPLAEVGEGADAAAVAPVAQIAAPEIVGPPLDLDPPPSAGPEAPQ